MTDSAPRDLDQLASDLVDGLVPPDEAARLRSDPEVAARVARIEALRVGLRATPPPPPPAGALDRMVAAALDASSASAGAGGGGGALPHLRAVPPPPSGPHAPPRHVAPPTPVGRSARPWLAAAAALVLGGLALAGLLSQGSTSDEDSATAGSSADAADQAPSASPDRESTGAPYATDEDQSSSDAAEEGGDDGAGAGEVATDEGSPTEPAPPPYIGSFDSPTELADSVAAARVDASVSPNAAAADPPGDSCPGRRADGDPARGTSVYVAEATYEGAPVTVHVYEGQGGGEGRLVATDGSCSAVVDVPYDG